MTYTVTSHQGAIETLWLHFSGLVALWHAWVWDAFDRTLPQIDKLILHLWCPYPFHCAVWIYYCM